MPETAITPTSPPSNGPTSPPRGLTHSPSIFGYQERLLQRTSSVRSGTSLSLLAAQEKPASPATAASTMPATSSPPSTPIRATVSRMINHPEERMSSRPSTIGASVHKRGTQSVDLTKNLWENRISNAAMVDASPPTPRSKRSMDVFSPPMPSSSTLSSVASTSPSVRTPSTITNTPDSVSQFDSARYQTPSKRSTMSNFDGFDLSKVPDSQAMADRTPSERVSRIRPASISSMASVVTPQATGSSGGSSARTPAMEDKLAQARANALRRRQEREGLATPAKANDMPPPAVPSTITPSTSATSSVPPSPVPRSSANVPSTFSDRLSSVDRTSVSAPNQVPTINTPPSTVTSTGSASKLTSLSKLFETTALSETPAESSPRTSHNATPTSTRGSTRSIVTPPSAPAPRYVPSGLSSFSTPLSGSSNTASSSSGSSPAGLSAPSSGGKYGSISKADNRRLGRHLPRIASGGEGWDEEEAPPKKPVRRIPSNLSRNESVVLPSNLGDISDSPKPGKPEKAEPLGPSKADNVPAAQISSVPSTPASKRRSYVLHTPKEGLSTPRAEVAGEEMRGLMSAVGSTSVRGGPIEDGEGVTGMSSRLRLSRSALPPSASSRALAPAPLPSRRLVAHSNWTDRYRNIMAEYEYLCHVGEALQWIEGCLDEETGFGVTEMGDGLADGVVLAKLARAFQGADVVKKIEVNSKHRWLQTENIAIFLRFLKAVGMPTTFTFDPIDLYDKKNIPKVIFCIHVLSHLLSRQGLAERIGNLVGQFDFTDEQLAATKKGLQGLAMPNFGDARKTLAKEASWEPEPEPEETEEERRDRELLECQDSIVNLQCALRARLAQLRESRIRSKLDVASSSVVRFQARARGALDRRRLLAEREQQDLMHDWATGVQTAARARLVSQRYAHRRDLVRSLDIMATRLQAQTRQYLARNNRIAAQKTLQSSGRNVTAFQAACRACLAKRQRQEIKKTLGAAEVANTVASLQAVARGRLHRQRAGAELHKLHSQQPTYVSLQSHLRGALVRRKHRAREEKLDNATDYIVAIQASCRGLLARQRKRNYVQHVQQSIPVVSSLQAAARARLARQQHQNMQKALAKVEVAGSVDGLQAFLRSRLAKKQTTEQKKKLEFVQPDVIGFQAVARGYLARQDYQDWRDHLKDPHTQGALVFLQSLVRGFLARRRFWIRISHYHHRVPDIVKIQAIWRGRTERQMYERLLTGVNVDVPTIQNYMHLLDDTDADYQRQIRTETLRREVVRLIRENQTLETEVKDLDTKIALILKNKMSFEDLVRAKHRMSRDVPEDQAWKDSTGRDPFTSAHLDRTSQRKLELFEYLFFMLQTKGEYLSRLLYRLSRNDEYETERRQLESVVLILFGYGQEKREDYLFHKLLQISVQEEILRSTSIEGLCETRFGIMSITTQYVKESITPFLQDMLHGFVVRIAESPHLDLSTDPAEIYRRLINEEESQTGHPSQKPRELNGNQVLQQDELCRTLYIQHLQELRHLTKEFLDHVYRFVPQMPFTIRLLAREALLALRIRFPDATQNLIPVVARTVILPFILQAIVAPEMYGMIPESGPIGPVQRRNLASIANLITHVASPDAPPDQDHFVRTPLGEFIRSEQTQFQDWVLDVASVDPLETHFGADELLENTVEPKPIMITRSEVYNTLTTLMKNVSVIAPGKARDPLAAVLEELEGPPIDYDRSKTPVCLRLTNRLAELDANGPDALQKEDWVQAKRHVLAVLRVQSGKSLFEVLVSTPSDVHEHIWIELVHRDIAWEEQKRIAGGLPQTPVEKEYQIQSIRSLQFHEVKSRAIEFCLKLERTGRLSRDDQFEGLLVSIAGDIRQKHHLRKMQRQNAVAMERAYDDMRKKHADHEEQIKSYHQFIDSSMASLQKGKKKPVFLSKQYFHQRSEARSGKKSKFGTYKYTAADLYNRGILLGINQLSPNVFNEVHIVLASNEVGVFSLELSSSAIPSPIPSAGGGSNAVMGREEMRMEDLLQAQFENEQNLLAFEGMATFSINMLIHQINKKFYSAS